uniref:Retrotransposon protein n=1 Tax=Cucumis melo TaxID=3656 RepID=A0A9I9CFF7_CUCME
MRGPSCSRFGWNDEAKCIIGENDLSDNWVRIHPVAKALLNKSFPYYDELAYVFKKDRATGRGVETFTDIGSNDPSRYEGFQPPDGNDMEIPTIYSQGFNMSQEDVWAPRPSSASDSRTRSSGSKRGSV